MARFLLEDVTAFLAGRAPLDPADRALFGHSFGGLFALWLLFTRPDAFRHWIAASPAITWEESFLLDHLARFDPGAHAPRVHLSAGEWEGDRLTPFQEPGPEVAERLAEKARIRTVAAAIEMADALAARGIETACEAYRDETHMSVLPRRGETPQGLCIELDSPDGPRSLMVDMILLATGYDRTLDAGVLRGLARFATGAPPDRDYRLPMQSDFAPAIFVQGYSEPTHGLSDTLLSVLALRAEELSRSLAMLARPDAASVAAE